MSSQGEIPLLGQPSPLLVLSWGVGFRWAIPSHRMLPPVPSFQGSFLRLQ